MATEQHSPDDVLIVDGAEPLTTVITMLDGQGSTITVDSDVEPEQTALSALAVFGAWSDLDWDEAAEALDRIRHESSPTPPAAE